MRSWPWSPCSCYLLALRCAAREGNPSDCWEPRRWPVCCVLAQALAPAGSRIVQRAVAFHSRGEQADRTRDSSFFFFSLESCEAYLPDLARCKPSIATHIATLVCICKRFTEACPVNTPRYISVPPAKTRPALTNRPPDYSPVYQLLTRLAGRSTLWEWYIHVRAVGEKTEGAWRPRQLVVSRPPPPGSPSPILLVQAPI